MFSQEILGGNSCIFAEFFWVKLNGNADNGDSYKTLKEISPPGFHIKWRMEVLRRISCESEGNAENGVSYETGKEIFPAGFYVMLKEMLTITFLKEMLMIDSFTGLIKNDNKVLK